MMKKAIEELRSALKEKNIKNAFVDISYKTICLMPFTIVLLLHILPIFESLWMPTHLMITEIDHQWYTYFYNYYAYPVVLFAYFVFVLFCVIKIATEGQWRSLFNKLIKQRAIMCFGLFCLMMIVSTCVNGFSDFALHGEPYRNESLFSYLVYFVVFFVCGICSSGYSRKKILVDVLLLSSIAVGTYSVINSIFYGSSIFYKSIKVQTGVFYNSNHYGYYLAMIIALAAALATAEKKKGSRIFYLIVFGFNVVILQFNRTLGAWVACLFALVFQIIIRYIVDRKKSIYAIVELCSYLAITGAVGLYDNYMIMSILSLFIDIKRVTMDPVHADDAGSARWKLWKITVQKTVKRPFLGYGVEGLYYEFGKDGSGGRSHCEYLQYASFFGIPAAVAYVVGCVQVFISGYRNRSRIDGATIACLVAAFSYLVSATFGNTWFYTTPYFFVLLGMGYTYSKTKTGDGQN